MSLEGPLATQGIQCSSISNGPTVLLATSALSRAIPIV